MKEGREGLRMIYSISMGSAAGWSLLRTEWFNVQIARDQALRGAREIDELLYRTYIGEWLYWVP